LLENLVLDQTKHNQEFKIQDGILNDSPPGFANNQRVPQKSDLKLLLENLVLDNIRHNQEFKIQAGILNDSLDKLSSKVDSLCTHNKMLETQISQVAQQVVSSSQTSRIFPSLLEANPKGQMNDITLRNGRQLEDPVVETQTIEVEVESEKPQSEKVVVESENHNASPPCKPKIPLPQKFDKSKLDEQFMKFIEIIQNKLPPKLQNLGNFSIPCVIESEIIESHLAHEVPLKVNIFSWCLLHNRLPTIDNLIRRRVFNRIRLFVPVDAARKRILIIYF